jgi:hypothetical protein
MLTPYRRARADTLQSSTKLRAVMWDFSSADQRRRFASPVISSIRRYRPDPASPAPCAPC